MRGEGVVEFAASPARAWEAITDANLLAACREIARDLSVEVIDAGRARVSGRLGTGFLALPATADIELTETVPGRAASWVVHGTAPSHFLDGVLHLDVEAGQDGGSLVRWSAEGEIRGPFAELARSALLNEGRTVLSETLDCLRRLLAE